MTLAVFIRDHQRLTQALELAIDGYPLEEIAEVTEATTATVRAAFKAVYLAGLDHREVSQFDGGQLSEAHFRFIDIEGSHEQRQRFLMMAERLVSGCRQPVGTR